MYNVYQHWDPLKVCIVGRSYPPEFYSWITKPSVRNLFEKIAIETEEDFQGIIKKLQEFGVEVIRPDIPENNIINGEYMKPPMTPRDIMIMVGNNFYIPANNIPGGNKIYHWYYGVYEKIFNQIRNQGNTIHLAEDHSLVNGAMISRIGKDLYFGTETYYDDKPILKSKIDQVFPGYRTHIVNTGGHSDGTYCPVCPGLIISLYDVPNYTETFPDWEVVYLPGQSWGMVNDFLELKNKNGGKWWIPGFEHNQDVIDLMETWLNHWTGYVEETVFDVNMLVIDPKNVMVFNYNKQVFDALDRYGITPHVVPFRHRYFWDGGIHCVTSDLHREGSMQDYFPNRQ